jgi:hypothetical protein
LTGEVTSNDQAIDGGHIQCGDLGTVGSKGISATFTVASRLYSVSIMPVPGYDPAVGLSDATGTHVWEAGYQAPVPSGVTRLDPDSGVTLDTNVIPDQQHFANPGINAAKSSVHIQGQLVCAAPGTPSNVTLSGFVAGNMVISHVNCNLGLTSRILIPAGREIDISGTVNGQDTVVRVTRHILGNVEGLYMEVQVEKVANWTGPMTGSLDETSGSAFHGGPLTEITQGPAPPPNLTVEGVVTCPAK